VVSLSFIAIHTTSQLTSLVLHDDEYVAVFSLGRKNKGGQRCEQKFLLESKQKMMLLKTVPHF